MSLPASRTFETIALSVDDSILTLTLNRPDKLNAFTPLMMEEIISAFDIADTADEVRAIIVTGSGRAFCAGADLSGGETTFDVTAADLGDTPSPVGPDGAIDWSDERLRDTAGRVTLRIFDCLKPVIGAVNGPAVGVGATMLLPMDFRVASASARIGFLFTRRGLAPEGASAWFLPRIVGTARTLEWCLTGRIIDADEALAAGLVRSIHDDQDALLSAARALAREVSSGTSPVAVAVTRQLIWRGQAAADPFDVHEIDSQALFSRGLSADVREGIAAFLNKRTPAFPDVVSQDMPEFFPWWRKRTWRGH
jgi:enoyl-CoA hydratase/carnithine racemase